MSDGANTATLKQPQVSAAAELTAEGLQWMLLRTAFRAGNHSGSAVSQVTARGVACDVWLNAYDAAPEAVRQTLHSVMATAVGNAWAPAIIAVLTAVKIVAREYGIDTLLHAFAMATRTDACDDARLSEATVARLFHVLQRCGMTAAATSDAMARALIHCASKRVSPRAFELLIAEPNADAALHGPTRCSAGDAHNPPRHHSVHRAGEVTVHDVLCLVAMNPAVWRAFADARLPFGARAMAEEWAYELTGPCGCPGDQRISGNPLHYAITFANDEAGEWLALRLPPKRLNEPDDSFAAPHSGATPLMAALRFGTSMRLTLTALQTRVSMQRTVTALLSRVPDVDLTLRVKSDDGNDECTAAEWIADHPPQWLSPRLTAELKLKTEQFGAQYLPSAAVLCAEALCGGVSVPRELVSLVLQYTALPQPNPWPNARAVAVVASAAAPAGAGVAAAAGAGVSAV